MDGDGDRAGERCGRHDEGTEELCRLRARVIELEAEVDILRRIVVYLGDKLEPE
jgi:hypothetical protein